MENVTVLPIIKNLIRIRADIEAVKEGLSYVDPELYQVIDGDMSEVVYIMHSLLVNLRKAEERLQSYYTNKSS